MNWLLALILASGGWGVRAINSDYAVVWNDTGRSITCYVYYYDGDFDKLRVRNGRESRPFVRHGLEEVECY